MFKVSFLVSSLVFCNNEQQATIIIEKTEKKFRSINDYQVNMIISIAIPAFRMPNKKYTVFFKQPDMVRLKSSGFGLLPKTGMFTSPIENFDNLTDIKVDHESVDLDPNTITLKGNLVVDSLAVKMPNDYARLTFKPTVAVKIDTNRWVITGVVTMIDTIKIIEIQNIYDFVDGNHYLPIESIVKYFVKDARISKWIKKDLGTIIDKDNKLNSSNDMVKGQINIHYNKYKVNRGLKDEIFK
jgi:hypothetical protein